MYYTLITITIVIAIIVSIVIYNTRAVILVRLSNDCCTSIWYTFVYQFHNCICIIVSENISIILCNI